MNPWDRAELEFEKERLEREDSEGGFWYFMQAVLICLLSAGLVLVGLMTFWLWWLHR